jgi:hypothetical protein
MHHRKHMPRYHYLLLHNVTADIRNTHSSIIARCSVFTELLPSSALIKSVTIFERGIIFRKLL